MNHVEYALDNFLEATNREEYVKYATGNAYAEADVDHFKSVSELVQRLWSKKFETVCPEALIIAGLYHDFDRVFPKDYSNDPSIRTKNKAIDTKNITDKTYSENEIKLILHPKNCAEIFKDYNPLLPKTLVEDISYMIERHELGGESSQDIGLVDRHTKNYNLNEATDILCEADGLSFFTVIIYSYVKDRTQERIFEKIKFSYEKLSKEGKEILREISFKDENIARLVNEVINR